MLKDEIINEVRKALDAMLRNNEAKTTPESTSAVKGALCKWSLRRGFYPCASGMKELENVHAEWLYDVTCLKYGDDCLKRTILVAECEWGEDQEIDKDFKKLLLARADVRLMIFECGAGQVNGIIERFYRYINEFDQTQPDDTYLFAAFINNEVGGDRFDYYRIDGEQAPRKLN